MMAQMKLDFYGDLTCPWCYLGWQRLHAALAASDTPAKRIHWKPYQLNPDIPVTGIDRGEYLTQKFGNPERIKEVLLAIENAMKNDGILVNLHRIRVISNTYLAHRLMLLAESAGKSGLFLDACFIAYFVQGKDIGDPDILRELAHQTGLNMPACEQELGSTTPHPRITRSENEARQLGIRAVPYILFNNRYSIAGAHDPIAFTPLIELASLSKAAG